MQLTLHTISPVAVIDSFERSSKAGNLLFSHGEAVEACIGNDIPKVRIDTKMLRVETDEDGNPKARYNVAVGMYKEAFLRLKKSTNQGNNYSAVNLSSGFSIPIEVLGRALDLELTRFNLKEKKGINNSKTF